MANDYKNLGQGSIILEDGATPTPNSLTIRGQKGGASVEAGREHQHVMSRNEPIAWAKSKGKPSQLSFEVHYSELKSRTTAPADGSSSSPRDFMKGLFTDAVSVGDGGEFEFNLKIVKADSGASGDEAETMLFRNCKLMPYSYKENEDTDTLSFTIMSLDVEPVLSRS